jgi:shikimate kinase
VDLIRHVDPRLQGALEAELRRRAHEPVDGLPRGLTVVLAGHRAAGKSTLLPHVAAALGRSATDLDAELEARAGRSIRAWFAEDPASFRAAEREVFASLPAGEVVAVGGGFLASHAPALAGCVTVLVPITWETFVERLTADTTRPRLMPEVPLHEELEAIWAEREDKHRRVKTMPFVDFLLALSRAPRPRRVVTLPPDAHPVEFAWAARHQSADLLEVRTDLTPLEVDLAPVARALPLLIAEREGVAAPSAWRRHAALLDGEGGSVRSHHAAHPLSTSEALRLWEAAPVGVHVKHVEPLGPLADAPRLFETQRALVQRFGADRVTVLATGPLALPFRALLAEHNALDFLALSPAFRAAVGQRLLTDAVRAGRRAMHQPLKERLGILGHPLAHSRSPRLHAQPFDRLEVPPDTDVGALLAALHPHYRGFAITNPFKKAVAQAVDAHAQAVNTLVRAPRGWRSLNTDVAGAKAALEHLCRVAGTRTVTVLGDGGVGGALREAGGALGLSLVVKRREALDGVERGAVVWTWPAHVEPPAALRFEGAHVGVIAYGAPARAIAAKVRALGGVVVRLGPRWFVAQAREQRAAWESAT